MHLIANKIFILYSTENGLNSLGCVIIDLNVAGL